ncbi:MAG TPA: DUF2244 domain-containing protein [Casimicrobiaceae bacterium]|nr:DUF2244 domain-containing protein [Casimicrobiaceae bacterium]
MPDAALPPLPANYEFCVIARHASALTARQRWLFFGILAGFSLGVGLTLTVGWGAWPVLPYSIAETSLLWLAFWCIERRSREWERLTIAADRVIIDRYAGGKQERREFNRQWVRVELEQSGAAWRRQSRLALRFAGAAVEFGDALPAEERARVARELKRLLSVR